MNELIRLAPALPNWHFIALIPGGGFDFVTTYQGVTVDPKTCWFLPLPPDELSSTIGVCIGFPTFDEETADTFALIARPILETGLGELAAGSEISFIEIGSAPDGDEEHGWMNLEKLPDYLEARTREA